MMAVDARDLTHIFCTECRTIRPAIFHEVEGRDITGAFERPTDIVCAECKTILPTLYRAAVTREAARPARADD